MRRLRSPLWVGGTILAAVVAVAVFAPVLAPYGPRELAGQALESPSGRHLLGTNDVGQDLLSQLVAGSRTSLAVALPAAALAIAVGMVVGVGAALRGGAVDAVFMRVVDVFVATPNLPLLVVIAALAGPSHLTVVLVIGMLNWPSTARTLRSETLSLRQRDYVAAARGLGGGLTYVVRRHLLPALFPVTVAVFLRVTAGAVFLESGLGFLGLSDPSSVSWGQLMQRAVSKVGLYSAGQWVWWVLPAGVAITLTLLGLTLVGVGLEPRMNPASRRAR